jgi:pimeloyl-ACP methyl ester carboxylesterase
VPLITVKSGAGRPRPGTQVGSSDGMTACFVQIPKLIVRVRFPSPAHRKGQAKPGILRAPGGHQRAVRFFSTRSLRVLQGFCSSLTYALHPLVFLGSPVPLGERSPKAGAGSITRGVSMSTFVLIHGGFCRGWVWAETAAALREDGHRVEVIDLPSCGAVAAELGDLQADIAAVRRTLDGIGAKVVLVAHSGGGMVLTEFADHPSVQHSVYLAALSGRRRGKLAAAVLGARSAMRGERATSRVVCGERCSHAGDCGGQVAEHA